MIGKPRFGGVFFMRIFFALRAWAIGVEWGMVSKWCFMSEFGWCRIVEWGMVSKRRCCRIGKKGAKGEMTDIEMKRRTSVFFLY